MACGYIHIIGMFSYRYSISGLCAWSLKSEAAALGKLSYLTGLVILQRNVDPSAVGAPIDKAPRVDGGYSLQPKETYHGKVQG